MHSAPSPEERSPRPTQGRRFPTRVARLVILLLLAYLLVSYFLVPAAWRWYAHRHPALEDIPGITYTANGIPGDPLNVALVGEEHELKRAMLAAGWFPADPLTLKSCLEIAADTVLKRTYETAPVSNLFLFGRKEDLAFEQPSGSNPRKRHHVRFWRTDKRDAGRPVWIGGATYDERVGLSGTTGQVTHHIAAEVDAERDHLLDTLTKSGTVRETYYVDAFHKQREGRNGGGDRWFTDGRLAVGVIATP